MVIDGDLRCGELCSEIAAFYAGFGQPDALRAAFHRAVVVVPLTADDRVYVSEVGGIDWLCAFTSFDELARYLISRGVESGHEYRCHTVVGQRIVDDFVVLRDRPTGVVVDLAGAAPMAFPPELGLWSEVA